MSEWIPFDRWPECLRMERPGIVFEVRNGAGQTILTKCEVPLPMPFDWASQPTHFRAVPAVPPRHSSPIPKPRDRR